MKISEYELKKDVTNCIPINKNRDLYVLETSFRKIQHPVHKRSMAKPYYALHLVTNGSGTLIAPEGKYTLKKATYLYASRRKQFSILTTRRIRGRIFSSLLWETMPKDIFPAWDIRRRNASSVRTKS